MRIFNGERIQKIMNTLKVPEDEPIMAGMVTRAIEGAQRKVEGHNFDIRKHLLDYDDVMNKQRTAIYSQRRLLLGGEGIERSILDYLGEVTSRILDTFANETVKQKDWDLEGMNTALRQQFGLTIQFPDITEVSGDKLTEIVSAAVKEIYDRQKNSLGQFFEQIAKMVLLQTIDHKWKEHLQRIDHLKEGISLRAYAQKDPVIEYKKEAFRAFEEMNQIIQSETIEKLLKVQIVAPEQAAEEMQEEHARELDDSAFDYEGADESQSGFFEDAGLPLANAPTRPSQQESQEMFLSRGPGPGDSSKLNRAQRRQMEKKKKKKLKI